MKLDTIQFITNVPVQVSLRDLNGIPKQGPSGVKVCYFTSEGRALWADKPLSDAILNLQPAEPFWICKRRGFGKGRRTIWDLWKGEAKEAIEQEASREPLEATLARSIDRLKAKTLEMPAQSQEAPQAQGTGTYGPVAVPDSPKRSQGRIPLNVAVFEIIGFTTAALKESGQQWSENSIQDLVSTVIISATKAGYTTVWER